MGDDEKKPPLVFGKSPTSIRVADEDGIVRVPYPGKTHNLQHEVELVLAIGGLGKDLTAEAAAGVLFGYAVGVDLTRRDVQAAAKERRGPWFMAKDFQGAAPLGPIHRVAEVGELTCGAIELTVGDELRQKGDLSEMIWNASELIARISSYGPLHPGDLIFTGTPAGVGRLEVGDRLHARVAGLSSLQVEILEPQQ